MSIEFTFRFWRLRRYLKHAGILFYSSAFFFLRNFHLRRNFCCAKKKAQRFGIAMIDIIVERKYRNIFLNML